MSEAAYEPDKAFLQKLLRDVENDSKLVIITVDVSPGCDKGDNFMSVVNRLSINGISGNGQPYKKSFISKNLPQNGYHQEIFQSSNLFTNETAMYRILQILLEKSQKLVVDCLYADNQQIILEDMKPQGFKLGDRINGLDTDHAKLVLEKLAELHAASLIREHQNADEFAELRNGVAELLFPDSEVLGLGKFLNSLPEFQILCLKAAATSEDDYSKEIAFINSYRGKIYDVMKELVKPAKYSVLCAGDLWINNFLFQYNEENGVPVVEDLRILDFQVSRFAPAVTDILYFLHTSVHHELLLEKYNFLLQIYYKRLKSKLLILNDNVFDEITFEWLKNQMEKYKLYGFFVSLWLAPASTMNAEDAPDDSALATQTAENDMAVEYWKERLSPRLLQRVVQKCKYFIN